MTQETSDLYMEILTGTQERYGCSRENDNGICIVGFNDVDAFIEDEGFEADARVPGAKADSSVPRPTALVEGVLVD